MRKIVFVALMATLFAAMTLSIESADSKIRVEQEVKVDRFKGRDNEGHVVWDIGNVSRIGPGGYAPIQWCIQMEDEQLGLKGYFVTFVIDPEKTIGGIDWEVLAEESNGPTGYRWTFVENLKYGIANKYLLALMGKLTGDIYNVFSKEDVETLDLDVYLCVLEEEPEELTQTADFFSKLAQESIFGCTLKIPDLEPLSRTGRHSWCIEEGIKLEWYERGLANLGREHFYPVPYIIVNKDARIGDKHKIAALVCSANPDSIWQWTGFNVISYEETSFIIEKPQVSQTLAIGVFIAFGIIAWYTKLWKKIGLG